MRSLYLSLALVMAATLSLTLLAFDIISRDLERQYIVPVFEAMDEFELDSARAAFQQGGRTSVAAYMQALDRKFGPDHYLLDVRGVDVASGRDLRAFLPSPPADRSRGFIGKRYIVTRKASDGQYWLLSVGPQKDLGLQFSPYAKVAICATLVVSVAGALGIVLPIRRLTATVRQFGSGELASRAGSRRHDEIGVLARSFNDMADRIERLVKSERRLLQDISHELRSPLARLKLAIRLARTAPDLDQALDRVEREAEHIAALTAELVETVRAEGETHAIRRENVNLQTLILEAVENCNADARRAVRCDVPAGDIQCDPTLLRRTLENVVCNAIAYSPAESPIDIAGSRNVQAIIISIRDYGAGVPDDDLEQIFAPFHRVDESRAAASGGIGLGLAIARNAIHLHGGTIVAQNAGPGLRITVTLPQ